jgi:hypothetical protein
MLDQVGLADLGRPVCSARHFFDASASLFAAAIGTIKSSRLPRFARSFADPGSQYWYGDRAGNFSSCGDAIVRDPEGWRTGYWEAFLLH